MAKRSKKSQGYVNPANESPDAPVAKTAGKPARPDPDDTDVQKTVARLLNEAIDYYESEMEPDQVTATEYYKGEPFGDEKEGRSKVVNTVLRDAVLAAMPSLMRICYQHDRTVEYQPRDEPMDSELAAQQTDYIRFLLTEENPGFEIFWSWIMDALVRRLGVAKAYWDDTPIRYRTTYTGLSEDDLTLLASDPEVEVMSAVPVPQPDGSSLYSVDIYRETVRGLVVEPVPNEEFVFSANTRRMKDSLLYAHVREVPKDDLLAMLISDGMSEDEAEEIIEENKGKRRRVASDDLDAARQFDGINRKETNPLDNEADDVVLYAEVYARIKVEDDPNYDPKVMPERRLFKCVGENWQIVNGDGLGECVDDVQVLYPWTPIPEPHTIVGLSFWDLLKDIQRIISQIERGTLDSLAQAVTPVTEVVSGEVNMQDFINPEVAGIRRVRKPGMTQTIVHDFVGGKTLPMLDYYGSVIEDRTGKNKGAMGLDADALQSTTKVAAAAILTASQQRIEILAKIFAETAMRPLFEDLYKLVTKHQQKARVVRLRGKFVQVDPRFWQTKMDVQVNVALGAGTPSDKLEALGALAAKQQELIQMGVPFVSNIELRNTLAEMTELAGQKNVDRFWKVWGAQEEQQMQQALAARPPQPDPNMALVEVERLKAATETALKEQEMQLKVWEAQRLDDRERDKIARDVAIKEKELELKYNAQLDQAQIDAQIERDRMQMDADIKREGLRAVSGPRTVRLERGA